MNALNRTLLRLEVLLREAVAHRFAHPTGAAKRMEQNIAEEIAAVNASLDRWMGKPVVQPIPEEEHT